MLGRLTRRAEYRRVAGSRQRVSTPGVIVQTARRQGDAEPRFGVTASRKVGGAVERNRARRRLRALAREVLALHAAAADYVLIARPETVARPHPALRADLENALRRLGAWNEGGHSADNPPART
ncbi:MAG: ribonuclease P protein component [Alphaproteobacteria bacterium]|nr:ribonuclease P protein component [Alphaproteobacteria bacterium]